MLNEFLYIIKMTILETQRIELYLDKFAMPGLFYDMEKTALRFENQQNLPGSEKVSDIKFQNVVIGKYLQRQPSSPGNSLLLL